MFTISYFNRADTGVGGPDLSTGHQGQMIEHAVFGFVDENGVKMGDIHYECDTVLQEVSIPFVGTVKGFELKSCEIRGEHGAFDIKELVKDLKGVRIIVAQQHDRNYFYCHELKTAYIPPLKNGLDFAIALHEIGHVVQAHDKEWRRPFQQFEANGGKISDTKEVPSLNALIAARQTSNVFRQKLTREHFQRIAEVDKLKEKMFNPKRFSAEEHQRILDLEQKKQRIQVQLHDEVAARVLAQTLEATQGTSVDEALVTRPDWSLIKQLLDQPDSVKEFSVTEGADLYEICYQTDPAKARVAFSLPKDSIPQIEPLIKQLTETVDHIRMSQTKEAHYDGRIQVLQRKMDVITETLEQEIPELMTLGNVYTRMVEYDATRRAYLWMADIQKKTGIDLFKMLQVDRHSILDTGATCKTGVIEHVSERPDSKKEAPTHLADVVTALQNGLATYGATTQQLRDRYGIVPHLFVPNRSDQEKDEAFFQQLETDIENISV